MAVLTEPNQVGIREELADFIANVDAKSTPIMSMIPKSKSNLGNMYFEWQIDDYATPTGGGVVDGKDVVNDTDTNDPVPNRARVGNYAEVFRRAFSIGFLAAEVSDVAGLGKGKELANARAKAIVEHKRDMEFVIGSTDQDGQVDAGGSTPYLTRSIGDTIDGTQGVTAGSQFPAGFVTPGTSISTATSSALTVANVQDVLKSMFSEVGESRGYDCVLGTKLKRTFTNFTNTDTLSVQSTDTGVAATQVHSFTKALGDTTYKQTIDVFEGDFGSLRLHPTTWMSASSSYSEIDYKGYILPMDKLELRYASLPKFHKFSDDGGGPREFIQSIAGVCVKNPLAFGMFNGAS